MKTTWRLVSGFLFTLLVAAPLHAQDALRDYLVEECSADLEQYCNQVTPGEGRLLHCVAAHEDKISGQCQLALFGAAVVLSELADAIQYLAESCATEIESLCADVATGEGRILACLVENEAELGEQCSNALAEEAAE